MYIGPLRELAHSLLTKDKCGITCKLSLTTQVLYLLSVLLTHYDLYKQPRQGYKITKMKAFICCLGKNIYVFFK